MAAGQRQEAAEHPEGRGLARAVRPQEAEDFSAPDLEGGLVHGGEVAEFAHQFPDLDVDIAAEGVIPVDVEGRQVEVLRFALGVLFLVFAQQAHEAVL